ANVAWGAAAPIIENANSPPNTAVENALRVSCISVSPRNEPSNSATGPWIRGGASPFPPALYINLKYRLYFVNGLGRNSRRPQHGPRHAASARSCGIVSMEVLRCQPSPNRPDNSYRSAPWSSG